MKLIVVCTAMICLTALLCVFGTLAAIERVAKVKYRDSESGAQERNPDAHG